MLGSAQCQRCGASILDGAPVQTPTPVPAGAVPTAPTAPTAPPPPPAPRRLPGFAPPPPPPPGWQPGPLDSARLQRKLRRDSPGLTPKSGCGCLIPLLLLFAVPLVAGVVGAFGALGDALDGAGSGGELQEEGRLLVGQRDEGGVGENERDRWTFAGTEGVFRVSVFADGDFDPVVEVLEESGRSLGRDDDSGDDRDAELDVTLSGNELYQLIVTGFGSSSGDYEILVEPARPDAVVPPEDGGSLTVGRPVTGEVDRGGAVRYRFVGEGREVTISAVGIDGFDPTVTVRSSDGLELAFDDDGGDEPLASLLEFTVAGGQTVIIEVAGFADEDGAYTLVVT